ncbi:DUF2857 domain-containing protein [Burkholderia glumae]|uniref:DUF2857 domain-containing protein n=1 Tax=Burkholderia glumae TaxID=337 RepID=UPI0020CF1546|nr:DUF2857 domain-containing protein [Burkholderia glumae]MCQ0031498.1 DUF2857 domain-containing protein [Burkholderia glumae]MCQ0035150.1 DUF2857 domain-containing protein [Burkholderia glumae]
MKAFQASLAETPSTSGLSLELSPAVRELIVLAAIRAIQTAEPGSGDDGAVQRIRNAPHDAWRRLDQRAIQNVAVHVDVAGIASALDHARNDSKLDELLAYFVANGTSAALLQRVFNLPRRKSYDLLSRAPAAFAAPKRPRLPGPSERDAIHAVWRRLTGPLAECYVELHRAFPAWSLATLEQVLNEFAR